MMRYLNLVVLLAGLILLTGCSGSDNTEPPAELTDFKASADVEELWSSSIGDGSEEYYLRLYPLMLSDRIITAGREGRITAIDIKTGDSLWQQDLDLTLSGGVGGNENYLSVASRDGRVFLLDNSGKTLWSQETASTVLAPPLVTDDSVIVRSSDGTITSRLLKDGSEQWTHHEEVPSLTLHGNSPMLYAQGYLFVGLDSGRFLIIDTHTGQTVRDTAVALPSGRSELERMVDIDGDTVLDDSTIYLASYQGRLAALDTYRGRLIWTRQLSSTTGVALTGQTLLSVDDQDHIWALDKNNGATLWKQDDLVRRQLTRPAIMGDTLVVADYEGYLHWLSLFDGHLVARADAGGEGVIVPLEVRGDVVYVLTRDGELSAWQYQQRMSAATTDESGVSE